jgi:hypothetical protein
MSNVKFYAIFGEVGSGPRIGYDLCTTCAKGEGLLGTLSTDSLSTTCYLCNLEQGDK